VFLGRRPQEPIDNSVRAFYEMLLKAIDRPIFRNGEWSLCALTGWPDNESFKNVVAWSWRNDSERYLVAVNLSDRPAQAEVHLGWRDLGNGIWNLTDLFSTEIYQRDAEALSRAGLYVELAPWGYHFLRCVSQASGASADRNEKVIAAGQGLKR
jgi:hypothetical protein